MQEHSALMQIVDIYKQTLYLLPEIRFSMHFSET